MRSITRAFRFAFAAGLLAGAAATQSVTSLAEDSRPSADKTPAPEQTPAQQTVTTQPPSSAPKTDQEITPDQMKGVSLEGLTEAQRGLAFSILSDQRCDCGCGMRLAACRARDATCTRSLGLANQVLDLVKQGKGRDEIIKAVLSPPSKYVQFNLPIGESPSVGPADARVTILYYLDHQ